jgi:Ca2+/Na+ antiporter
VGGPRFISILDALRDTAVSAFFNLVGVGIAVLLIVTGFVYLVSPRQGLAMLKRTGSGALLLFFVAVLVSLVWKAASLYALIGASLVVSVTAYFIRESRRPHRQIRPRLARLERKPVLPREGTE